MACPGCNTRTTAGQRKCPNCGRALVVSNVSETPTKSDLARRSESSTDMEIDLDEPAAESPSRSSSGSQERPASAPQTLTPDPASIRRLLAEDPDLLEPKLRVLTDAKGKPVGLDYATDVGDIDLLARDAGGSLVVVMVAKGGAGTDIVSEALQRIGWVRKHLAKVKEGVRGVVLMESAPGDLSYTAAAVSDTVSFKTYKMSLAFHDLEI